MTLTQIHKDRILEIEFWRICVNLKNLISDTQTLFQFIDTLKLVGNYQSMLVQKMAYKCITDNSARPGKLEIVGLLKNFGCSVREIQTCARISNTRYYDLISQFETDPPAIYTRWTAPEREQMKKFLDTYKALTKIGVSINV